MAPNKAIKLKLQLATANNTIAAIKNNRLNIKFFIIYYILIYI